MGVASVPVSSTGTPVNVNKLNSTKSDGNSSRELEDRFLKLLIAQMKNQDPTNPMDNSQLTSQLAQISTLAGIEKLNTTVGEISGRIDNGAAMEASQLIGKGVMVPGDKILVETVKEEEGSGKEGGLVRSNLADSDETKPIISHLPSNVDSGETVTTPFGFELDRDADSVVVTIMDSNDKVVHEVDLGAARAGVSSFTWDGKLKNGSVVPDGSYKFKIEALSDGQKIPVTTLSYSVVYGVIQSKVNNSVLLDLGLSGTVSIDEVRQII